MKKAMTVKELKDMLARYHDDDLVEINAYCYQTYAHAVLYVDYDEVMEDESC